MWIHHTRFQEIQLFDISKICVLITIKCGLMLTSADNKTDIVPAALQSQQFLVNYCHRNGIKLKYHKAKGTTFLLYARLLSCTPSGLAVGTTQKKLSVHVNVSFVYRTLKSKGGDIDQLIKKIT